MQLRVRNKRLSPYRLTSLILATILTVGIFVGGNAALLFHLYQDTLSDVQVDLQRQSLTLSELIERTFQSVDLALDTLANKMRADADDSSLKKFSDRETYRFLRGEMAGLPQIDTLGVLDASGRRVTHSRVWPSEPVDLSGRQYFQALKQNAQSASYISDPLQGVSSGQWSIILAHAVRTPSGEFLGVVFSSTVLKYIEDLFRLTSLGNGYAATLLKMDGTLLARYPMAGRVGMVAPVSTLRKLGNSRSAISRSVSPVDHQARIAAAYRLTSFPLVVVVTQNEDAAFSAWRATAYRMSIGTAAVVSLLIVAAFLVARSWRTQDRLNAARAQIIESGKNRALAEAELKRQRDVASQNVRFNAAVENMSQGLSMWDAQKRLIVCNKRYAEIYRLSEEETKPGTDLAKVLAARVAHGTGREDCNTKIGEWVDEITQRTANQSAAKLTDGRYVSVTHCPMSDGGWVSTHEDVTARRREEEELDETKKFLNSIIENIPVAVTVKDANTRKFVLVNRRFEAMLDLPRGELLGRDAFDFYSSDAAKLIDKSDSESLKPGVGVISAEYEIEMPRRGNCVLATSRIVVRDIRGEPKYLVVVIDDITERKKSEQRISFMAHHDMLTGLANRAAAAQRIEEAGARHRRWGEPFTVLLLDLDRFKNVNDTLGHGAGDELLRETASRLKSALRETDLLARLGGDEFAIVQLGESEPRQAAIALADRLIELISKPYSIEGHEVNIATSIGIALAAEHGTNPESLLKMADMALYKAKSAGRNGYCFFDPTMSEAIAVRNELEKELRRAIQNNQFELHYQPIVDAKLRNICAAEALIRWRHPTKGLIRPDQFIPIAEESGLISELGEWVLNSACQEAVRWPSNVHVAVNLSAVQLRKRNLAELVDRALTNSGLDPRRLELEITETALIEWAADCLPVLRQLKERGVVIALDDFGTGYSSLSHLTMFPFDKIKIDKSFTQNIDKRRDCAIIVSATLTLARGLDIVTTAEGIETAEQSRLLQVAGVSSLQGYFFQRPVPASEIDFGVVFEAEMKVDAA